MVEATSRSIGAGSPFSAARTAAGKSARSVGSKSPSKSTERIPLRRRVALRRCPLPLTTKPLGAEPQALHELGEVRLRVVRDPRQAFFAQICDSSRGSAAKLLSS